MNRVVGPYKERAGWRVARAFFAWTVRSGHARVNAFAGVAPTGRPRRGKPQLRIDEARAFLATALRARGRTG